MLAIVLLRFMITIKRAYTNADPIDSITPVGLIVCVPSLCVMINTPPNVAAMASQTGHDGTTLRNTIMIATRTGYKNTRVVASPEAIYSYASKRNMLLEV